MSENNKTEENSVGMKGTALVSIYLILTTISLFYGLMCIWPSPAVEESDQSISTVNFLIWTLPLADEVRLLIIVALSGAIGAMVHSLRSFYWYAGHRELKRSWLMMYVLLPFVGASIALVFYLVIRGGFFSPGTTIQQTSLFGFAAMAGLVGMFTEPAILKLKQVAETLLTKPQQGDDSKPQETQ